MKKVLFLALAAAAVMSCSESEEIENARQKAGCSAAVSDVEDI